MEPLATEQRIQENPLELEAPAKIAGSWRSTISPAFALRIGPRASEFARALAWMHHLVDG
jgi:hypothetical protein